MVATPRFPERGPASRVLAGGGGWSIARFVCESGPGDAPFEERHDAVSVAAVLEGTFTYSGDTGRALLHPGALLLGNPGACYACGHDHGRGDICLSARIAPDLFAEVAASHAGQADFRFARPMLPAGRESAPGVVGLAALAGIADPLRRDEAFLDWLGALIRRLSGETGNHQRASAQDEKRIARVLRHMDRHAGDPLDLDLLAGVAAMSKFHFLRVFRRVVGVTPHRYLVTARLRRAAAALGGGGETIASIAFEAGFGDLSTFNAAFRAQFGMTPRAFRALRMQP